MPRVGRQAEEPALVPFPPSLRAWQRPALARATLCSRSPVGGVVMLAKRGSAVSRSRQKWADGYVNPWRITSPEVGI